MDRYWMLFGRHVEFRQTGRLNPHYRKSLMAGFEISGRHSWAQITVLRWTVNLTAAPWR